MAGAADEWSVTARVVDQDGRPAWIVRRCGGETVAECSREGDARLIARLPLVLRELLHRILQLEEVWWRLTPHGGSERLRHSIRSAQTFLGPWIEGGFRSPGIEAAIEAGLMDEQSVAAVRPDGDVDTQMVESASTVLVEMPKFYPVPIAALQDPRLKKTAIVVLGYLNSFWQSGKDAFPSYRRMIADTIGDPPTELDDEDRERWISSQKKRMQRTVARLKACGYLSIIPRYTAGGDVRTSNKFTPLARCKVIEASDVAGGGGLRCRHLGASGVAVTRSLTKDSSSYELEEAHASKEAAKEEKLTYGDIYGAWRLAWKQYSSAPWEASGRTQRDVTEALRLGTLDGLDLERFFTLAIKWLTTRKDPLTVSLRAAINNAPAIQHDLGSCELKPQKSEVRLDPRVAAAVRRWSGGEGERDGERGSGSVRAETQPTAGGV